MRLIKSFLPLSVFLRLSQLLEFEAKWSFTGRSRDCDSESFWFADLSETFVQTEIQRALNLHGFNVEKIHAVYANGQSRGQSGGFHVDANDSNVKTCLIYCNDVWKQEWGGFTLFEDSNSKTCDGFFITPEPNKAVIFDGCLRHMGCAPDSTFTGLRKTVAFKFS